MTTRDAGECVRIAVIGSGITGLARALSLSLAPVTIATAGTLESEGATRWAQGSIAAAVLQRTESRGAHISAGTILAPSRRGNGKARHARSPSRSRSTAGG